MSRGICVDLADWKDQEQSGQKSWNNYSSITIQNLAELGRAQQRQPLHHRRVHPRNRLRTENSAAPHMEKQSVNEDIMKLVQLTLVGVNRLDPVES